MQQLRNGPRLTVPERAGLVLAAAATLVIATALSVAADPWGTGTSDTGAHPDADPHTYCYSSSVGSDLRENIENAEWNAMDPTAVNVNYQSSCDLSSSSETDVVWRQAALSGAYGSTYCEDFDNHCDQFYSTLDLAAINVGANDEIDQTQTACHELGHTGGLTHGGSSGDCMINSGDNPPTDVQYRRYGEHHRSHLTAWFN